jgi:release factor glutamine methyltransferase
VTLRETIAAAAAQLAAAGVETPRLDAELLLLDVLGRDRGWLLGHRDDALSDEDRRRFDAHLHRRARREPVSRIIGEREFWSLPFRLAPDVLDPRPDTETLVEAVLKALDGGARPLRVLDLGTGSGCILLALLSELPAATGIGVDISIDAARVARDNARRLGLDDRARFVVSSWGAALAGRFDLVVSNPPYIASAEIGTLAPEVARFEPLRALDGGNDGLDAYRAIAAQAQELLAPQGRIAVEIGAGQGAEVTALFAAAGLDALARHRDLADIERVLVFRPAAQKSP